MIEETWVEVDPKSIDLSTEEPFDTRNSLHIFEARYNMAGTIYRTLTPLGGTSEDIMVEKLVSSAEKKSVNERYTRPLRIHHVQLANSVGPDSKPFLTEEEFKAGKPGYVFINEITGKLHFPANGKEKE